jgi:hypothetical protein
MTATMEVIDRVIIVPDAISREFCDEIIQATTFPAGTFLTAAQHYDIKMLERGESDVYDKLIDVFDYWTQQHDPTIPYRWIMVMRYQDGEGTITRHCDTYVPSKELQAKTYSLLIYLNDIEDGGETRFFTERGQWDVQPKAGTLVIIPGDIEHEARISSGQDKYTVLSRHN